MRITTVGQPQRNARAMLWRVSRIVTLCVFAASVGGTALASRRGPPVCPAGDTDPVINTAKPDHFLCYRTQPVPHISIPLLLEDQLETSKVSVRSTNVFCAPANKSGEDPLAPMHADHLRVYALARQSAFVSWTENEILPENTLDCGGVPCFGPLAFDLDDKPLTLMVPAAKSLTGVPPRPTAPNVDHFQCHPIVLKKATPFTPISALQVQDQFATRIIDVLKPTRICAPVNKHLGWVDDTAGEDPTAPKHDYHLLCYSIREHFIKKSRSTFFAPIQPIYTNTQFFGEKMAATNLYELCVPAKKVPGT